MKENIIKLKTFEFGKQVVRLCVKLEKQKYEFVLSKQFKRSGTAPGALVRESEHAESKSDFIHKMSIALKEANECEYWIELLVAGQYISKNEYVKLSSDCKEIIRILASIVKTSKRNRFHERIRK